MSTLHPLEDRLAAAWPPELWRELTVLLAISGGADSVALLRAMAAVSAGEKPIRAGRVVAAHFNHRLRGEESDADEAHVLELCRRLDVPCEVGRWQNGQIVLRCDEAEKVGWVKRSEPHPDPPETDGGARDLAGARCARPTLLGLPHFPSPPPSEDLARQARYEFLEMVAARRGARYVVTAHTADDQAETILHRILRGTGVGGLAGMARARPLGPITLIRPLLGFRRCELVAYLNDLGQSYREDSSNRDTQFTRNRIRRELLPLLASQYNAGVVEALLRLGALAGQSQAAIELLVDELTARCVHSAGPDAIRIDAAPLAGQSPYLLRELLIFAWRRQGWPMQAMGLAQWEQLENMLSACGGRSVELPAKKTFPGDVQAEATAAGLVLARSRPASVECASKPFHAHVQDE